MTEEEAYQVFKRVRWPPDGEPVCPVCAGGRVYTITTRRKFKCCSCYKQFSVTSGTLFASRKMSFKEIVSGLRAIDEDAPINEQATDFGMQWRTTSILAHKAMRIRAAKGRIPEKEYTWRGRPRRDRLDDLRVNYPFMRGKVKTDSQELVAAVSRLIPKGIPEHLRQDVCQDTLLLLLETGQSLGGVGKDEIKRIIRNVYKMYDLEFETVSLDAPLRAGSTFTLGHLLTDEWMVKFTD